MVVGVDRYLGNVLDMMFVSCSPTSRHTTIAFLSIINELD